MDSDEKWGLAFVIAWVFVSVVTGALWVLVLVAAARWLWRHA